MSRSKIVISLDAQTMVQLDRLVEHRVFSHRSQVIQEAVEEKLSASATVG